MRTTRNVAGRMTLVLALTAAVRLFAAVDDIVPMPKQVGDPQRSVPLEGWRIVTADDPKCRIGAMEINSRVRELGGPPLPVEVLRDPQSTPMQSIVLAPSTLPEAAEFARRARVTDADPGPQGYAVHPEAAPGGQVRRVLLVGSDPQGALYAAVTLRRLVVRGPGGALHLQPVEIRDWPDYLYRCCGTSFAESRRGDWYSILGKQRKGDMAGARALAETWIARQKRYVDWMLRAKINVTWNSTNFRPGDAPAGLPVTRDMLRKVHVYALARGIRSIAGDTTAIGRWPQDKDNPDFQHVVFNRPHKRYFCWSRLDLHRKRARRAAQWLRDCGYTGYYLHACDSGGWRDPALWSQRCPRCREKYGDDHAAADAAVFNTYYREIRKAVPNLLFNVVVYPYNGRYLDPDYIFQSAISSTGDRATAGKLAQRTVGSLRAFLARLNTLLPPDVRVCLRESERGDFQLARDAWGRRDFYTYFEYAYWKGWRPYFVTTPLFTKSLFDPGHRTDILFGNASGGGWRELTQLLGVECAWNVNRPGAREFDSRVWHNIGTRVAPLPERRTFALRACRFWFGEKAGPLIAPVFAENISWQFIAFPEQVQKYLDLPDAAETMRGQARAAGRAGAALDRFLQVQQEQHLLDGDRLGYVLSLCRITHGARILARYRAGMLAARKAIEALDAPAARAHIASAKRGLAAARPGWDALKRRIPAGRLYAPYMRTTAPPGFLANLDLEALTRDADALDARVNRLIAAYSIPAWFQRTCRKRTLEAVRSPQPPQIDGVLDDSIWQQAPRIEHFTDHRTLRLESLETVGRLGWDDENLYVAFECMDPNPTQIATFLPGPDRHALCDSVEVLFAARPGSREFRHWIVDSKGTVFDAARQRQPDGTVRYSTQWNGRARVAVRRSADRWTVEMALPAADLGMGPKRGREASLLLCRNIVHTRPEGEEESVAVVFLDGNGFHAVDRFARVRFADAAGISAVPQPELTLRPVRFHQETTGDGAGTRIGGGLRIETDRSLHDVEVTAVCTDGIEPLGRFPLGAAPLVELVWRPKQPFSLLFDRPLPGVECRFELTAKEGRWNFVRRFGRPRFPPLPDARVFTDGISGKALAVPACFVPPVSARLRRGEGTLEFWVRPRWEADRQVPPGPRGDLEHTLINVGPIRPDHPGLSNWKCLTLCHNRAGYLRVILANAAYESRSIQASIRGWRPGEWHHVAFEWKLDDAGRTSMALYVDGRLVSNDCRGSTRHPNDRALVLRPEPLPVQIGSMTTGFRPADADIDELRVSGIQRYRGKAFIPARAATSDADTVLLFHFNGTLDAERPSGLRLFPGPAQQQRP